jgi:hypothetical protein
MGLWAVALMQELPDFSPELMAVLNEEISAGNQVVEVSAWPPLCRLFVMLEKPFHRRYEADATIVHTVLNDPHYWLEDYSTVDKSECLACRF